MMKKTVCLLLIIAIAMIFQHCGDPDPGSLKYQRSIKLIRVNWTGVTIKTAILANLLKSLGYRVKISNTSVRLLYKGLSKGEADIFLGNWMPSQSEVCDPYFKSGTVVKFIPNMMNAKYTLAVPDYVAEAGLTHFKDIARFKERLDGKIHGIEEGNDGNIIIQKMIEQNMYNLKDFKLIASSEAGMLARVKSYLKEKKWIVFLGWSPHQMNKNINMVYLNGSTEETFGADNGSATIYTNFRKGFDIEYPNITKLLRNMTFPIHMMNEIMDFVNNRAVEPELAGLTFLNANPEVYRRWLSEVKTVKGQSAIAAFKSYLDRYFGRMQSK